MEFTEDQLERYSRHIILPEVGGKGQRKIRQGRVLVVGAGGLGSPCAYYLAAAGVGKLGLADSDEVELSNLQRQILHFTPDIGRSKAESGARKLAELNPDVEVVPHRERLTSDNVMEILEDYDVVADGSDNFPTRFLMSDACYFARKPLVHAAVLGFQGQAMTIVSGQGAGGREQGACYRCVFPTPPPPGSIPNCQQAGIMGPVAGVMGMVQALEALKLLLGIGDLLVGRLLAFNALKMTFRTIRVRRNPHCPLCGEAPSITELLDYQLHCGVG